MDVFDSARRGEHEFTNHRNLFCGFLHCCYRGVYGTCPVVRKFKYALIRDYCGLDKPLSGDTVDRFLADLSHVIDDAPEKPIKQAAVVSVLYVRR